MNRNEIRILVVEDEEIIRMMFRQSFESWGYQVDCAENGKEALEKCQKEEFHIVVTDLNMPVMDGMELLKKIKSRWPYIEVIVITGFATIESAIEAMKLGAHDFILKPVNFEHVQFTINKCYQRIRAQAENTELRELNRQLSLLNEMKDKFIYITNHEIRTPLTIFKGYLEILDSMLQDADPELREILEVLQSTADELNEIVDKMQELEALEKAQNSKKEEIVDLKKLISRVYKEMVKLFNSRNIVLKVYIDKNPLLYKGDYRQLLLVFRELLQNALKFTPDGGKVIARLELKNNEIFYSVKDNGVGIPFDKQNMIFEKFYEIQDVINHRTSKQDFMGGGMGIGLTLVKEIVESMRGKVLLDSEPGKGSTFTVVLPIMEIKPKGARDVSASQSYSFHE